MLYLDEENNEGWDAEEANHKCGSNDASKVVSESSDQWLEAAAASMSTEIPCDGIATNAEID